jgi:hypothetical protein
MSLRKYQSGVSLGGLMIGAAILVVLALLGLKLAPSYIEFFQAKKAIVAIAQEKQGATVIDIRKAFDQRAAVDGVETVRGSDLEVTKDGAEVVISFGYRKDVPMFAGIGLYIDFQANSKP